MSSNDKKFCEILEQLHKFDYVRFNAPDIFNGMRGRVVPARAAAKFLQDGVGAALIWAFVNPSGLVIKDHMNHIKGMEDILEVGNIVLTPTLTTWHEAGWALPPGGEWRTADLLCELRLSDNTPSPVGCPRSVARRQVDRLKSQGMSIMSSIELEFRLEENGKPIWPHYQLYTQWLLNKAMPFLNRLDKDLHQAGIDITSLEAESGAGQLEITYKPAWGLNGADWPAIIKGALREIANSEGKEVNFMSRPEPLEGDTADDAGAGAHFNLSIWDKEGKQNLFHDPTSPNQLSKFARQWIAGLVEHAPALTAIYSPTVNCYRRMGGAWAANDVSWGIDTRYTTYRIKTGGAGSTYVEVRSPSGLSSPYLVMAATIAAGLDGVEKKMDLGIPMPDGPRKSLPTNLEAALVELEKNDILKKALGESFVEWYCVVKRKGEIELLADCDIDKEIEMYKKFC